MGLNVFANLKKISIPSEDKGQIINKKTCRIAPAGFLTI
jgi:hypothetical protein